MEIQTPCVKKYDGEHTENLTSSQKTTKGKSRDKEVSASWTGIVGEKGKLTASSGAALMLTLSSAPPPGLPTSLLRACTALVDMLSPPRLELGPPCL